MYNNYQIVVNTAAGRRRYMQYLIPFIVSSDIVDRYDIWVNTHNGADIEFFKQCAKVFPKINLVWQPDGIVGGISSINAFYRQCIEDNTIYFKLDDDIVWMEPNCIEKMVKFRVDNPDYFLVTPLVINNALSTYLLQVRGKLNLQNYQRSDTLSPVLWRSGDFAAELHTWFLTKFLKNDKYQELHVGKQPMGMCRFSINSILWFGSDMKKMNGVVPGDDEEYLSSIYPTQHGLANCWNGDAIMAHFAFFTQREQLDKAHILEQYGESLMEKWCGRVKECGLIVQEIMKFCNEHLEELMAVHSPYKMPKKAPRTLKSILLNRIPWYLKPFIEQMKLKASPVKYIK